MLPDEFAHLAKGDWSARMSKETEKYVARCAEIPFSLSSYLRKCVVQLMLSGVIAQWLVLITFNKKKLDF